MSNKKTWASMEQFQVEIDQWRARAELAESRVAELEDSIREYTTAVERPNIYKDPGTIRSLAFETLRKALAGRKEETDGTDS